MRHHVIALGLVAGVLLTGTAVVGPAAAANEGPAFTTAVQKAAVRSMARAGAFSAGPAYIWKMKGVCWRWKSKAASVDEGGYEVPASWTTVGVGDLNRQKCQNMSIYSFSYRVSYFEGRWSHQTTYSPNKNTVFTP